MAMIEDFKPGDETEVSDLVRRAFDRYIAPDYTEEGLKTYRVFTGADAILKRWQGGDFILCYKEEGEIVGVLDLRDINHICLFFVDPDHHKKGIGGALMAELFSRLKDRDYITVNASLYARKIYEKLGFQATGDVQERDGIVSVPMRKDLS